MLNYRYLLSPSLYAQRHKALMMPALPRKRGWRRADGLGILRRRLMGVRCGGLWEVEERGGGEWRQADCKVD